MRNISVFVSSTFNDMQTERDLIRDSIAPELQDTVRKYGCNLDFVDLRWGINTKDMSETEANRKILQTCFDEIHNSRPFFVAFIAERYGWVPDSEDVREAFRNDGQEISDEDLEKSITELEIDCALHSFPDPEHCLFFFRKPIDYGDDEAARHSFVSEGADKRKLELLKQRILRLYPANVAEYDGVWNAETQRVEGLEELEVLLGERIGKTLEEELSTGNAPVSPTEECIRYTESLISSYNATFAGREAETARIFEYLDRPDSRLATLVGDSGSGKSALMSHVAVLAEQQGYAVLPFFAGCHEYAQSAEHLMDAIATRACTLSGTDCPEGETATRYYSAVNNLALHDRTLLIVDAVNQLAPSASEEMLVWLNMFALHPSVKVLLSATPDYDKLRQLVARNSEIIDIDAFSDADVGSVSQKFFHTNHRQINDALLNAIVSKEDGACNRPVYLMTLLTRLNNIGKEDFAAIHRRERELGESPIDAIFNYLTERVHEAPSRLELLLDDFLKSIAARLGDICYIFTAAIAGSRRGVSERFLEKICLRLGYTYHTADFSYYRKLLGAHITQRENGAWDIAHLLVKQVFRSSVPETLMYSVTHTIADCLTKEDSIFKRTEYAYYLRLTGELVHFAPYLKQGDSVVADSLVVQINEDRDLDATAHLFDDGDYLDTLCSFVSTTVAAHRYSAATAESLSRLALEAIYRTEGYKHDERLLTAIADIYAALGRAAAYSGYNSVARDYLLMAVDVGCKAHRECAEDYRLIADISRRTGNILGEARYRRLYKRRLAATGQAEQLFDLLYERAIHCTEHVTRTRTVTGILAEMRALLPEPDALHCARMLTICARAHLPLSEDEVRTCTRFVETQADNYDKALVLYSLAYACPDGRARAEEAYRIVKQLLAVGSSTDTLRLATDIAELLTTLYDDEEKKAQMKAERLDCLAQLNALAPDYATLTEYMHYASKGTPAYREARKQYREASRGVVSTEYLIADKVMLLILIGMCAVYLVLMPIFFTMFNGINYILDRKNQSAMDLFMTFYTSATFESFYNMAFCFAMYSLLQVIRPRTDYASRKRWGIRTALYFGTAGLIVLLYYILYSRLSDEFFSGIDFVRHELNVLLLLSSELAVLMLAMQEVLTLCMREFRLYPYVRSRRRFVADYPARAAEFAVNAVMLAVFSALYLIVARGTFYDYANIGDWTSNVILGLPRMIFVMCVAALALFMLARFIRLTVLYIRQRRHKEDRV